MTLSADDDVTLVEIAVIVIGFLITWAVYRRARKAAQDPAARAAEDPDGSDLGRPTESVDRGS